MKTATAELEVLGVGLTTSTTVSCTSSPATTGTLSEAFALLRSAGLKLDAMSERLTSTSFRSSERKNHAFGKRTSRAR